MPPHLEGRVTAFATIALPSHIRQEHDAMAEASSAQTTSRQTTPFHFIGVSNQTAAAAEQESWRSQFWILRCIIGYRPCQHRSET